LKNIPDKKIICLIVPSLLSGGMERVISEIANDFSTRKDLEVHLIILTKQPLFYSLKENVIVHEPQFKTKGVNKVFTTIRVLFFLRKKLKELNPYSFLSFGGKYNSFVMLSAMGLKMKKYISDRNSPQINSRLSFKNNSVYKTGSGFQYILKHILYPGATGIIVQTLTAKRIETERLRHPNIICIPNPVRKISFAGEPKKKIILNVGRFVATKQQELLIEIFSKINYKDWKLVFAGEGPLLKNAKKLVQDLKLENNVEFAGNRTDIDKLYQQSEIFAFTSVSEGFPNALAEALNTPLATIAIDCIAGPSDLIDDGYNGFLVEDANIKEYQEKLTLLTEDAGLREKFKVNSLEKMKNFEYDVIMNNFYDVMIS
jgi:GalNAc-alpha-(1->4)-GalNAc-alpha-(1->3)-diNAcBac-PP-undecaprenol alpha-1,4-N-acetyl-D-galactosaminyltransferase